ncbi:putative reverse transcriptase domain-containing protein [Tanacetum coccineum]
MDLFAIWDITRGYSRLMVFDVNDHATRAMMCIHVLEDRAHIDTLEDTDSVANVLAEYEANRGNGNGDDSLDSGSGRRTEFEKMESVFHISNCIVGNQVKFTTCTLLGNALTWWNSHIKTIGYNAAYGMPWKTLIKMMTDKYCPRGENKKLEIEIYNLKVKGIDVVSYTQRFQELALLCGRMFPEVSDMVENYVGGLPDMIQGSVMASKPKTIHDAIEFATELMDQKIRTFADDKLKTKGSLMTTQEKTRINNNPSSRILPRPTLLGLVTRENMEDPYPSAPSVTTIIMGHYKRDYPKLKNKNPGNQAGNGNAQAKAYALGEAGTNLDSNVVTGTFLLNNCYASILFDTGANRIFLSTAFSYLIDIAPTTADGKIRGVNTIIRGCTLNFLNHSFNIDLMPIPLGSFDVIIGMDWLSKYHAVIVCDENIVRVPFGDETLIFRGDGSNHGYETRLNIISCTKTEKYLLKGCPVFLAHITAKKDEDKLEEKRLEDVPIVRDFPEVFLRLAWYSTCPTSGISN